MNIEAIFLKLFKKYGVLKGVGDDGVILDSSFYKSNLVNVKGFKKSVIASDIFAQNIHFKLDFMSLENLAAKSMLVNISDLIAMGAIPKYALLSIIIPKNFTPKQMQEIALGLAKVAKKFGIFFIGGDTTSGENLVFSLTLIGELKQKPILRSGVKRGDLVFIAGNVGDSLKSLKYALNNGKLNSKNRRDSSFVSPKLELDFSLKIAPFIRAGMDISDGVNAELNRLSKLNNIGFKIFKNDKSYLSGEEYKMLIIINPKDKVRLTRQARIYKIKLNLIAKATIKQCKFKENIWH